MDETNNKDGHDHGKMHDCGGMCGCGGMMGHGLMHGHKHGLLRLVIGLVILGIVFSLGMKIGEFKAEFGYGGFGHMCYMQFGSPFWGDAYWGPNFMMKVSTSTPAR